MKKKLLLFTVILFIFNYTKAQTGKTPQRNSLIKPINSYKTSSANLKIDSAATCPTSPVVLVGQSLSGPIFNSGKTFACGDTAFYIQPQLTGGGINVPCIQTEYKNYHPDLTSFGTETIYESNYFGVCFGPSGCSIPLGGTSAYPNNTPWSVAVFFFNPTAEHEFVFCRSGSITTTTVTVVDCWTGDPLPSNPAYSVFSDSTTSITPQICDTIKLPANTDIGTTSYSITPASGANGLVDSNTGWAYVSTAALAAGTYTVTYSFTPSASSACPTITGDFIFTVAPDKGAAIKTIAGDNTAGYGGDGGPAIAAQLNNPRGVAVDAIGNVYIADEGNYVIRKIDLSGTITTFAGTGVQAYSGDGGPAISANLESASYVAVDAIGNVYLSGGNSVRKINTLGIISTFAGTGSQNYSGDGGPATAAELNNPYGIAADAAGNIYIVDAVNAVIRKVDTAGIISTFGGDGNWGSSGDGGPAISAELSGLSGIATDPTGNVYITNYYSIRKIDTSGIITTVAGSAIQGYSGDGGAATSAEFYWPRDVAVDAAGNIYVSDANYWAIRKVNTLGIISLFAGNVTAGYSGDGGPAICAQINSPFGICTDASGNLFIADFNNQVIREVGTCIPAIPQICMVQVDSSSKNNIIYWDKTAYTADTFYVYRDTANYNYALIGKVPYSALSMFTDTVRSLYAANGDPNASSWRYKIAYRDTCGGIPRMSPMSPWHQTLFMVNSGNSFIWTMYQIEGQSLPVPGLQSYLFERDDNGTGNYVSIQTLSASSTSYTDINYAAYQNTANWRVETKWNTVCTPTLRLSNNSNGTLAAASKSRSNVRNNRQTGIQSIITKGEVTIYPNPSTGVLNIKTSKLIENASIEIYNVLGEKVFSEKVKEQSFLLDISNLNNGVYQVSLLSNNVAIYQNKIVKQ
jgi:hypothetical protein